MTWTEVIGLFITLAVMGIGVAGAILPALPGPPIVFAAALGHKLIFLERGISWWFIALLGVITILSLVLDFVASLVGAKKLGATWRGATGAVIGGIFGLFWLPLGLLIGPMVGAVLMELTGGRQWREASKAGFGAVLGVIAGTLGKLAMSIGMVGLFCGAYVWLLLNPETGSVPELDVAVPVPGLLQSSKPQTIPDAASEDALVVDPFDAPKSVPVEAGSVDRLNKPEPKE
jgi:uncharacterized protein YqgC (DUF456 family)